MKSSLSTTYFITKDMKVDLHEQNLNGVLPILYAFIARADKSITNVTLGSLSSGGAFGAGSGSTPGVRINYTDNQSGNSQTMYYFTTDISDGGIKSNPGFLKFCQRLGVGSSFLKSCSYLMFENGFGTIRNFMLIIGPISSLYDFVTFGVLLWVFRASEALFQTGWFVESLTTQTLILFVIRTAGNPLRSRPSLPLAVTGMLVVLIGVILPFTPLAATLGFVPLPGTYFLFLGGVTITYLLLVEVVKRRLMRTLLGLGRAA